MSAFPLILSHAYKGMRERTRKQAEGKTTLLGVGWIFPHCHWTDSRRTGRRGLRRSTMPAVSISVPVAVTLAGTVPSAISWRTPDDGAIGRMAGSGHDHDRRRIILNWCRGVVHRRGAGYDRRWGVVHRRRAGHNGWRQKRETKGKADRPTGMCRSGQHGANPNQTYRNDVFRFHSEQSFSFRRHQVRRLGWRSVQRARTGTSGYESGCSVDRGGQ
jgi:hypothetical protein